MGHSYTFEQLESTSCEFCSLVYRGVSKLLLPMVPNKRHYSITFPPYQGLGDEPLKVHIFFSSLVVSLWCSVGTGERRRLDEQC